MYSNTLFTFFMCKVTLAFLYVRADSERIEPKKLLVASDPDELGFINYPQVGWINYNTIPTTWAEARLRCTYKGAVLMSPITINMRKSMLELSDRPIWTGIHATNSKGNYFTIEGEPLSKLPIDWEAGEPDNVNNNEDCLVLSPNGEMADRQCNHVYPYICYKTDKAKNEKCGNRPGYESLGNIGSCYKFHNVAQTWSTASKICAEEGSHLAVIDVRGENDVLKRLFARNPLNTIKGANHNDYVHLGFNCWDDQGLWMTINGKNIDNLVKDRIISWDIDQPGQGKQITEFCGSMRQNGLLHDSGCQDKLPFICEHELNQNYYL